MTGADRTMTAVIVSWNTVDLLDRCLTSLRDHAPAGWAVEVIVVDNASTDGSPEMVRDRWPEVALIANDTNRGYTAANNQAIERASGEQLLLINADAFLTRGCADTLLERMDADPRAGVVGPRLVYGDGTFQRWTAGRDPGPVTGLVHFSGLGTSRWGHRRGLWLGRDVDVAFEPDWVSSACMLVRRATVDDVGAMDETWFVYMDDVDLCRRVRVGGWRVWYEPSATAIHLMGQSTKRQSGAASPAALRNLNRYVGMHRGSVAELGLRGIEAAGFAARAAAHAVLGVRRSDHRPAAQAHWKNLVNAIGVAR